MAYNKVGKTTAIINVFPTIVDPAPLSALAWLSPLSLFPGALVVKWHEFGGQVQSESLDNLVMIGHWQTTHGCSGVGDGQAAHAQISMVLLPSFLPHGHGGHVEGASGHTLQTGHFPSFLLLLLCSNTPHGHVGHGALDVVVGESVVEGAAVVVVGDPVVGAGVVVGEAVDGTAVVVVVGEAVDGAGVEA